MRDKGKNGDGKVNNSQVAISLAASFLCFSELPESRAGGRGGKGQEGAVAGASEKACVMKAKNPAACGESSSGRKSEKREGN